MKKIIVILLIFSSMISFAQQADQAYVFKDKFDNTNHYIEPSETVRIYTNDTVYKGNIDSIKHNEVYINSSKIQITDIEIIKYKKKNKLKTLIFIFLFSFAGIIFSSFLTLLGITILIATQNIALIGILGLILASVGSINFWIALIIFILNSFIAIYLFFN